MKKKKATKKDKEFVFKITLDLDSPMMWSGKINPKIRKSKKQYGEKWPCCLIKHFMALLNLL